MFLVYDPRGTIQRAQQLPLAWAMHAEFFTKFSLCYHLAKKIYKKLLEYSYSGSERPHTTGGRRQNIYLKIS